MQVGKPVGVMALDQDLNEWYGQQPLKLGMGYRPCERLSPSIQVLLHVAFSDDSVLHHITLHVAHRYVLVLGLHEAFDLLHVGTHDDVPAIEILDMHKLWQRTAVHAQGLDEQHVDTRMFASGSRGSSPST